MVVFIYNLQKDTGFIFCLIGIRTFIYISYNYKIYIKRGEEYGYIFNI